MPWRKQFDVDTAREQAKNLFWSQGYVATSMEDLLKGIGINRASFYDTFGSKHALYRDVLQKYDQVRRKQFLADLRKAHGPRDAILALFASVRDEALGARGRRGCFLANAALELAPSDKSVGKLVRGSFSETEEFLAQAIRDGQALGEVRSEAEPRATAALLLGLLLGMRVLARAGMPAALLEAITSQVSELV